MFYESNFCSFKNMFFFFLIVIKSGSESSLDVINTILVIVKLLSKKLNY